MCSHQEFPAEAVQFVGGSRWLEDVSAIAPPQALKLVGQILHPGHGTR